MTGFKALLNRDDRHKFHLQTQPLPGGHDMLGHRVVMSGFIAERMKGDPRVG